MVTLAKELGLMSTLSLALSRERGRTAVNQPPLPLAGEGWGEGVFHKSSE